MDDNLIFDHFGEVEAWVINGKSYFWNGGFHVPIHELRKLSVDQLPLNEKIQPIEKEVEDYIIPSYPDLYLIRTAQGIVVNVESVFYSEFWTHPGVPMQLFIDCLVEEIRSNKEFVLNDLHNEDFDIVVIEYETKLIDVQSIHEAINSAVHSMKSLEKRVNWRLEEKLG
ncbi:hypothetical protein H1D32_16475 [Anaerobacillus sp. CMMVII]|uniref:hypothetical protein n=1 Tax=Anaerobacillus sp. CMMVII TaxID=2755588 RepID=UPI0021B7726E|nr:hypothetical protein [Anaerobacillus sp. CMMVII]MCT8139160.1 hypothetical protein [Anaerobacillus sp. CMMVII]